MQIKPEKKRCCTGREKDAKSTGELARPLLPRPWPQGAAACSQLCPGDRGAATLAEVAATKGNARRRLGVGVLTGTTTREERAHRSALPGRGGAQRRRGRGRCYAPRVAHTPMRMAVGERCSSSGRALELEHGLSSTSTCDVQPHPRARSCEEKHNDTRHPTSPGANVGGAA
jgi:hypothetical protein